LGKKRIALGEITEKGEEGRGKGHYDRKVLKKKKKKITVNKKKNS